MAEVVPIMEADISVPLPPEFSEDALARLFTARHSDELRYVAAWNRWFRWNGNRWVEDNTQAVFDLARMICREQAVEALHNIGSKNPATAQQVASRIASAKTIAAVVKLAGADRTHAATVDQWDADAWLMNTPGGTVDLRTGILHTHNRLNYCTKMTSVTPAPENTPCPQWTAFLQRVMNGDEELIRFLQRVAGYVLTGITNEHALFFAFGTGRNGKGVFLNTLTYIMDTYAEVADMEILMDLKSQQHPTGLAKLRGARLVTAQEVEQSQRWAEAKIKALTGGDPVTARLMRQDFFTFIPQFKLFVAGNHKPSLKTVDEAIKARMHLVPFTITIPQKERDTKLSDKLKKEWPAILRWMVDGCVTWQQQGLTPPAAVRIATNNYLLAEDVIGRWMEEQCRQDVNAFETIGNLFKAWKKWAEDANEYIGSQRQFSENIRARGYKEARKKDNPGKGRFGFNGICLIA